MKKLFISLVVVVACFTVNAQQKNVVKTNPISLAFGSFNASYERVLNSSSSVVVSGNYMYKLFGSEVTAGGLGAAYRYYFTHAKKAVPAGFYIAPEASFSFGSVKYNNQDSAGFSSFGIGAEVGYQWVWSSGFTLDLGIGPMYRFIKGSNTSSFSKTKGILPTATFGIGYAF